MSTTKQLKKLISKVSNKKSLNQEYSIELLLKKLNKIYLAELEYQEELNKQFLQPQHEPQRIIYMNQITNNMKNITITLETHLSKKEINKVLM